jgi:hypothetical protein
VRLVSSFLILLMLAACEAAPVATPSPAPAPTATIEPTATVLPTATPAPGFGLSEAAIVEGINRNVNADERKLRLESETTLGDGTLRRSYTNTIDTMDIVGGTDYPYRIELVANWPLEIVRPPLTALMINTAVVVFPTQLAEFVQWYNGSQGNASMTFRFARRAERLIDPRGGVVIVSYLAR